MFTHTKIAMNDLLEFAFVLDVCVYVMFTLAEKLKLLIKLICCHLQ